MIADYLIRLDDACPTMNKCNWDIIESLLDRFQIKPLVAVIPDNKDKSLFLNKTNSRFWDKVREWNRKGWSIAMHGYQHIYTTNSRGIVPIGIKSEFAGIPFDLQRERIRKAWGVMLNENIKPEIWVAPSHTFDSNTLKALYMETEIRIISDGIALNIYYDGIFYWIPQQLWRFRYFPFGKWTVCLHPNTMEQKDFNQLEQAVIKMKKKPVSFQNIEMVKRKKNVPDKLFERLFFFILNRKRKWHCVNNG